MDKTQRLILELLRRVSTPTEALVVWVLIGLILALAIYWNRVVRVQ